MFSRLDAFRKLKTFLTDDYDVLKGLLENDVNAHERFQRREFFRRAFHALSYNGIDGDYAEFGCGKITFALAYAESRRAKYPCHLWALDSFQGLPPLEIPVDLHPMWVEGLMCTSLEEFRDTCRHNSIPESDYDVVPGFYQDTLRNGDTSTNLPSNISLAYIDCDLYSSTRLVLKFLSNRLKHGMIIALDDYFCWSKNTVSGERKAFAEFFDGHDRFSLLPYCQYSWGGMSFILEDKRLLTKAGTN